MKDFAKLLSSKWMIDANHLHTLMARVAAATPEAVAAAVAAYRDPQPTIVGDIAVIECSGPITHRSSYFSMWYGSSTIEGMRAQFRAALNDPAVKTIVFRVDSPGGVIDMVPEFADEIFASRDIKPSIAVADSMIASAAAWLFFQCGQVYVPKSGQIGSIGTYMLHQDISKMLADWGIKMTFIYAGEHKVEGNPYEALSEDAHAQFQSEADEICGWFNAATALGRGVTTKVVLDSFGQGRMFYGQAAVKTGLADKVGSFDALIGKLQGGKRRVGVSAATFLTETTRPASAGTADAPAVGASVDAASTEEVEPDDDGNCPDGYEKRDGMCYRVGDEEPEASAKAPNHARNIMIALAD